MDLVVLKATTVGGDGAALGTAESELEISGRIIARTDGLRDSVDFLRRIESQQEVER